MGYIDKIEALATKIINERGINAEKMSIGELEMEMINAGLEITQFKLDCLMDTIFEKLDEMNEELEEYNGE